MLTGGMNLPTSQWKRVEKFFPDPPRRRDGRGRPWAANRACLEGILWLLRSGARWRDMPVPYPSGVTCWRRLRRWQELGIWEQAWRQLLRQLDQRGQIDWDEAFVDATFLQAKKGARRSAKPCGARE
jgi:transposase